MNSVWGLNRLNFSTQTIQLNLSIPKIDRLSQILLPVVGIRAF
ncbi:hypothetical protein [Chamaesiphon sp. VAR_48_metabat_135_sub]|nr:hypothetical protein [Chamaesiphon sp. VAR_48_metabat_135_sub]